jgi:signal transduction histidine kinase
MSDSNRILVIDDNETGRYAVCRILRRAGFEVFEAGTAADGLRLLAEHRPRILVLDVQLPDMDGRDLCQQIRANPETASVIVLQTSATYVRDEDMVQALESGADASLAEPIDPTMLVATVRALVRARKAEDSLRDALAHAETARRAAEDANRAKDEFLATLSHELRSPLGAILTWATLLRTGQVDEARTERAVAAIERNARAQAKLIEDLLDMSRIVSGGIRLEPAAINLPSVIEAAAEASRPAAETKGIQLELALERLDEPIAGDGNRLQQAVSNLIANAVKFTPDGGRVDVQLRRDGDEAHIAVTDTGRGIEAELLPLIFERFRQGDSSSTRREGGLGLGLAIVRHMIELHGGRVDARSDGTGKGATFELVLPLRVPAAPSAPPAAMLPAVVPRLDGVRVLLVDDESDAREASRAVLESAGALVVAAGSVREALAALRAGTIVDLVVSDIAMPEEDGYTLMERARALGGETAMLPAIALTAYAGLEDQHRARAAGFLRHLAKPVVPSDLVVAVSTMARRRA